MRYKSVMNRSRKSPNLRIVRDEESTEATVLVYDIIDFFGVNAEDFVTSLSRLDVSTIHVRINSPGGNVFDGVAIANALRNHAAKVIVHIDGLAASIASVIAMAGDEIMMADNAFFMIHDPWTITLGNARELRKTADILDKMTATIANDYVKRVGDEAQVKAWMAEESWFNAEEALSAGFIDSIEDLDATVEEEAVAARAKYDLNNVFKHAPAALVAREARSEPTVRDLEAALRDAGCSISDAKEILAKGYSATRSPRDVVGEFAASARQVINTLTS